MTDIISSDATIEKIKEINEKLQQVCPLFEIQLFNPEPLHNQNLTLSLIKYDESVSTVSTIEMFKSDNDVNVIYINISTSDTYQKQGFITFLIAVLVLIGNTIYFKNKGEPSYKAAKIGLTASNPESGDILIINKYRLYKPNGKRLEEIKKEMRERLRKRELELEREKEMRERQNNKRKRSDSGERKRKTIKLSAHSDKSNDSYKSNDSDKRNDEFIFVIDDYNIQIANTVITKFYNSRAGKTCLKKERIGGSKKRTRKTRKTRKRK